MPGGGEAAISASSARSLRSAPRSPWKRSTEKRRLGRSNPRIRIAGSFNPSRSTISSRTGGAAVAVSASTGGRPSAWIAAPSRRYSGRKSWPHSDTQCASSTTNSEMSATDSSSITSAARQLLGREEEELERALGELVQRVLALGGRDRRVQLRRTARGELVEGLHLVALERDQRRDDDRRARGQQPGDLVDRRLARAGRHHDQRVVAGERGLDPLPLSRTQLRVSERLSRDPVDPRFVGQEP